MKLTPISFNYSSWGRIIFPALSLGCLNHKIQVLRCRMNFSVFWPWPYCDKLLTISEECGTQLWLTKLQILQILSRWFSVCVMWMMIVENTSSETIVSTVKRHLVETKLDLWSQWYPRDHPDSLGERSTWCSLFTCVHFQEFLEHYITNKYLH